MLNLNQKKQEIRKGYKPSGVSPLDWANAINWNIEVWKCVLSGQKWNTPIEITCPEQFDQLKDSSGKSIIDNMELITFKDNYSNRAWATELRSIVNDLRAKGEWIESLSWVKLLNKVEGNFKANPNEEFIKNSKVVKGHRLIKINKAA